ncbi:Uncharacterized protein dnm_077080 [Desulfonema magnum]|uniref:Uncharacterized protein n=1 Tax=Desulfonema magnum TaxID=45655 RepID=A0A975BTV2_9BACT|nr:Uncharacterized protein dnm_077080 [Desulfonema magnum]
MKNISDRITDARKLLSDAPLPFVKELFATYLARLLCNR